MASILLQKVVKPTKKVLNSIQKNGSSISARKIKVSLLGSTQLGKFLLEPITKLRKKFAIIYDAI